MGNLILGQYCPGTSVVHRTDPRIKLFLVIFYLALVFVAPGFSGLAVVTAFTCLIIFFAKIPFRTILNSIKPLLFIVIITALINLFFVHSGEAVVDWMFFTITTGSIYMAIFLSWRLALLLFGMSLLTLTTSPIDLTDGAEHLMRPFERIGFPAHEFAMMMGIALRFLPVFMDEAAKIKKAQEARGADFESGNFITRGKSIIPILVPLFVSAFRHADELAMAMESRCYHGGVGRTRMHVLAIKNHDYAAIAVFAVALACLIVMRVVGL
ncbi:MAG: energy-coupling factor transporter transmembrane protein EcfT [Actinobacteria bacterium]|nr:energy-coupling factor transporter transmembrane protein EcfT [Actinomycetota bacterium]